MSNLPVYKKDSLDMCRDEQLTSKDIWIQDNIHEIVKTWDSMKNYLNNLDLTHLDKCDFNTFLDFVVKNSTHYRSFSITEEESD